MVKCKRGSFHVAIILQFLVHFSILGEVLEFYDFTGYITRFWPFHFMKCEVLKRILWMKILHQFFDGREV